MNERDHQQRVELARTDPKAAAALKKSYDAFLERKAAELRPEAEKRVDLAHAYIDEQRDRAERWKHAAEEKLAEMPKPPPKLDRTNWRESLKEQVTYFGDRFVDTADKLSQPPQERAEEEARKTPERRQLDEDYRVVSHAEARAELERLVRESGRTIQKLEQEREATGITVEGEAAKLAGEHYPQHAQASAAVSEHHSRHEKERQRLEQQERKRKEAERRRREKEREQREQQRGGRGR
jgi:hypothetical protein